MILSVKKNLFIFSGVLSGSVYKDYALLKNGFPAENVMNGSVIVVKTHEWGPEAMQPFDKAILLVREPFSSLRAEFNRRSGGHIGHASADKYKRNNGRNWRDFVYSQGGEWEAMNLSWMRQFKGPIMVMFYDKLREDVEAELRRTFAFLGLNISQKNLGCVLSRKEGIYKRSKKNLNFEVFDPKMMQFLEMKKSNLYQILDENNTSTEYDKPS